MNKNKKDVGLTIKQIRKERGISQEELSKKMGFKDHSGITKIETGQNDVNSETLMELAKYLEVNVGIFFTGKTSALPEFKIIQYKDCYRDDMIFMVLSAEDALKKIPSINPDLLDVKTNYIDKGDMFWVAIGENNRVVGCVGYETIKPLEARLHRLYVKSELKRQGIGTALLNVAIKHVREKGYNKISIHTGDEKYLESKLFYKAFDFVEVAHNIIEKNI
ncbi:MAG: GNAT family N-acetyltransferase [Bacilli bacterium]|nr:GNAT family N-acetyltransferase [Bacilli bacterium]